MSCITCQKFGPCGQAILENAREQFRKFASGLAGAQLAVTAAETRAERVQYSDLVGFAARIGCAALPAPESVSECFQIEFCKNARRMGLDGPDCLELWRYLPESGIDDFLAAHDGFSQQKRTLLAAVVDQVLEFRTFDRPRVLASFLGSSPAEASEGARRFCRERLQLDSDHAAFEEKVFLAGTADALRLMLPAAVQHANRLGAPGFSFEAMVFSKDETVDAQQDGPSPPPPPPRLPREARRSSRHGRYHHGGPSRARHLQHLVLPRAPGRDLPS